MRLTLRTLLAYLDDTLEAEQAREIGLKIAQSPQAQELITRIRKVARRRRLLTPSDEAELDANAIAEYLDNQLTPEQVARIEEAALKDDVYLAEIAASHQILTLVMGEPVLVPPTARERMYELQPDARRGKDRKPRAKAIGRGAVEKPKGAIDDEEDALLLGLPLVGRGAWLSWALPLSAAGLLVAASLAVWMAIDPAPATTVSDQVAITPAKPVDSGANQDNKAIGAIPPVNGSQPKQASPEPEAKPSQPSASAEPLVAPTPPAKTTSEAPRTTISPVPANRPTFPPRDQPPGVMRREIGKISLDGNYPTIAFRELPDRAGWQRFKPDSRMSAPETIMALPGFRSELKLDSGVSITLWGNLPEQSRIPVLESTATVYSTHGLDLDMRLERGRVVIANRKPSGFATVRLRFANQVWDLSLNEPGTEVSAELIGIALPMTDEPNGGDPALQLPLVVLKGEVSVKAGGEEHLVPAGALFAWDNDAGVAKQPQPLPALPEWAVNRNVLTPEAAAMAKALEAYGRKLTRDLDVVASEVLQESDPAQRVLAVRTLGALSDYAKLLSALGNEKYREVRVTAAQELKLLIGLGPANHAALYKVLLNRDYREKQAVTFMQLLHGLPESPSRNDTLLEYLASERLPVRQLTHLLLLSLYPEGRQIAYDPAGDARQRDEGIEKWRQILSKIRSPR